MKGKILQTILLGFLLAGILFSCQSTKVENTSQPRPKKSNYVESTMLIKKMPEKSIDPETMKLIKDMGVGWNAGNSLEALGGEIAWGNPKLNQAIFNAVKEAGFNTVRLPVGWSKFSDRENYIIESSHIIIPFIILVYSLLKQTNIRFLCFT